MVVALCAFSVVPARVMAQGDGPHNLPLIPISTNIFTPQMLVLSGNFNPAGNAFIPFANVDALVFPLTLIRTFALGSRFGRLFVVVPVGSIDASATAVDPRTGETVTVSRGAYGFMDPIVVLHIGLVGAPALKPAAYMQHPKSFTMLAILGASPPLGEYDDNRLINLGTNRWTFRTGIGMVFPFGEKKRTALEMANSLYFFTTNNDVILTAGQRTQDPLYVLENHLTHNFTPKLWASLDVRWQYGGETTTDGVPDDNLTNILGGGASLGYQFTPHFGAWTSFGRVWAGLDNAKQNMVRLQFAVSY